MSQSQLAELIAANTELKQYYESVRQSIDDTVSAKSAQIDQFIADARSEFPMLNLLPYSGRFDNTSDYATALSGTFDALDFAITQGVGFQHFNGSTVQDGGQYVHNSSTYGGTQAALSTTVEQLVAAMGLLAPVSDRYGTEFRIAEYTAGAGTVSAHPVHGDMYLTAHPMAYTVSRMLTTTFWFRVVSGEISSRYSSVYIDGLEGDYTQRFSSVDGWRHAAWVVEIGNGYENLEILAATPGTVFQMALPAMIPGNFAGVLHATPVRSIGA